MSAAKVNNVKDKTMASSIIDKTRDAAELYTGLARIGAGMVKARAREALGIPTLQDCDECGGTAYEMRTVDGERTCISCVETRRQDLAYALRSANDRADKAEATAAELRKNHDRAKASWVTERAALMRQRDEAQGRLAEAQGSIGEQMMETALVAGYRNAERARADKAEAALAALSAAGVEVAK